MVRIKLTDGTHKITLDNFDNFISFLSEECKKDYILTSIATYNGKEWETDNILINRHCIQEVEKYDPPKFVKNEK